MDEDCEDKQDAMQCKIQQKKTWKKLEKNLKNGLNKKIYEKLNDERGRKKISMWILLLPGTVHHKKQRFYSLS